MLNVSLETLTGAPIENVLGFDSALAVVNCNSDTGKMCIIHTSNLVAKPISTNQKIRLSEISERNDIFIYHAGNLIFHSENNGAPLIELFLIPGLMSGEIQTGDKDVEELTRRFKTIQQIKPELN